MEFRKAASGDPVPLPLKSRNGLWRGVADRAELRFYGSNSVPLPARRRLGVGVSNLFPGVGAGTRLEADLLADGRAVRIGAIQRMDYDHAVVLTHDRWKFDAGGIPQFCFLLATARELSAPDPDDDEVLLLRVEGTAPLTLESDLHAVREETLRDALSSNDDPSPSAVFDVSMDPYTRNRVSFTGLRCRILGTFYEDVAAGQIVLEWGHDVDNFYATSTYRVFKPIGDGLTAIASYLKPGPGERVERVRIGAVRYSSTRRRAQAAKQHDASVEVNIHDFIGHKTGMFGMTRMGKSNTMKTIVARTFAVSERQRAAREPVIGQLIFDPQGEYANPNTQDGTEIAAIGQAHVRIFAFGADGSQPHVRPLGINFFDPAQVRAVQGIVAAELSQGTASGYVRDFAATDFADDPNDFGTTTRAERGRLCLYAALIRAGFALPTTTPGTTYAYSAPVRMKDALRQAVEAHVGRTCLHQRGSRSGYYSVAGADIVEVVEAIITLKDANNADAVGFTNEPRWQSTEPIFTGQTTSSGAVRGWRNLLPLRPFHNPATQRDVADDIYNELLDGKVVIVDLHIGAQIFTTTLAERICGRLIERQTEVFTSGHEPPHVQVVLEEAHNLFTAERYKTDVDVWVRLAKEASKLQIGLIYATQEVTGVAHQVLANTKNWVVAHLNNKREVAELSKFYDFESFADAIITSEDKGYVRLKTMSSPYIIPVQIDRYGLELVNEARAAAGDAPLHPPPAAPAPAA